MLEHYWPDAGQVNACIKNEAETAEVAVLLAVHQPASLVRINEGSDIRQPVTEQDLLNAFLTDTVPSGTLLLPITGASGAGKSHIIRWLDAQLQRCPQARPAAYYPHSEECESPNRRRTDPGATR